MKNFLTLVFFLLVGGPVLYGQDIDSTNTFRLKPALVTVIRQYLKDEKGPNLSAEKSVLVVRILEINDEKYEFRIDATNSDSRFAYEVPAFISELDGYTVAIFGEWHTSSYIQYPKPYLDQVQKKIISKLKKNPKGYFVNHKSNAFSDWEVTFYKDNKPVIRYLHGRP